MLKTPIIVGMATLMLTSAGCAGPYYRETSVRAPYRSPHAAFGISYFYDELAPYGRWIEYSPYGWCWTPYEVDAGWRPYSNGYWVHTEFGWAWASYEPWGWASYHYGRWLLDPYYGWLWVPGTVWAPAWVAWHYNDDWVGWAPLPPAARWDASAGLRFREARRIPASHWCFVQRHDMAAASLRAQVVSVARNATLLAQTRDATRFEARGGRPVNEGVDVALVERAGRTIQRLKVADADSPARGRGQVAGGGVIRFFRPEIRETGVREAPPPRVREREVAIPAPVLERQREAERHRLEESLARERARLEREQARALRARARGQALEEIRRRHAAEQQAFEGHAAEQRQLLEHRIQKKIVKPPRAKDIGKTEPGDEDQGKRKGERSEG